MTIFPIGTNPISFAWHLLKPDGTAFSTSGLTYELYYSTGRGSTSVQSSLVTGQSLNIITWTMTKAQQTNVGNYSLLLVLKQNNSVLCKLNYRDAFALFRETQSGVNESLADQQQLAVTPAQQVVTIYSSCEYYSFQPVIPTIGENNNWYINGVDTGKSAHCSVDVDADGTITFDKDKETEVIYLGLKNALATAASDHSTATSDHSTATSDHSTAAADHVIAAADHVTAAQDHATNKVIQTEETATIKTIQPNHAYKWGVVSSLAITLAEPADNTIANEYIFEFRCGSTATDLSPIAGVTWTRPINPYPNTLYQVVIFNGIANYVETDLEG